VRLGLALRFSEAGLVAAAMRYAYDEPFDSDGAPKMRWTAKCPTFMEQGLIGKL